jgi:hypothetical protein
MADLDVGAAVEMTGAAGHNAALALKKRPRTRISDQIMPM